MDTKYTLKNFRVFDEQGATFEMAPLTILTGCNSSGKSSMTKSLMLLSPLMSLYKKDIQSGKFGGFSGTGFANYNLDFTRGKHKLGSLDKVVNWKSKDNSFTVAYSVYSFALGKVMDVILTFGKLYGDKNSQALRAQLQKVEVRHEDKIFYQYQCGNPTVQSPVEKALNGLMQEDRAYVNLGDWKTELIKGLQILELGFITNQIREDCEMEEVGQGYASKFHYGAWTSLEEFYGKDSVHFVTTVYDYLEKQVPKHIEQLCKKFDFKNLKFMNSAGGSIDWKNSDNKFEFPYEHLYSLNHLMDELNAVSKEDIIKYAETRFIHAENVAKMWYNTDTYQQWIRDIFAAYVTSDFVKFSDFYNYFEKAKERHEFVYFGTRGGDVRYRGEGYEFLFHGTARTIKGMGSHIQTKSWAELNDTEKFTCIFWCLQGFAGYEDYGVFGAPSPSLPLLDILREYATLVCAELFTACDFITEADFIELDRSNTQRVYSFEFQGTDFNSTLDRYFNLDEVIHYDFYAHHLNGKTYRKGSFSQKWLKKLTGFDNFSIEQAPEGIGYYVFLQKITTDGETQKILLADLGYGLIPLLSMLLRIELRIGVYLNMQERATVYIEEPESNLHPKLQSLLAEIFVDAVDNYPINIVLETHSEYLIRKLQVMVAEDKVQSEKIALHYLYSPDKEQRREDEKDMPQVKRINILPNGLLSSNFGSGFLDEAGNSQLEIIRKARSKDNV